MTVYYIRAENGAIKIGYTSQDIRKRMRSLSTSSPLNLELLAYESGDITTEKQRHKKYSKFNIRGEWFAPCDSLNKRIKKLNPQYKTIPYWNNSNYLDAMMEFEKASNELENIKSWYTTNNDDPPKIAYVTAIISCLYVAFVFFFIEHFGFSEYFIGAVTFSIFPIILVGYILTKIWQFRRW